MKTINSTTDSLPTHDKSKLGVALLNSAMALATKHHSSLKSELNIFHIRQELALGNYDLMPRFDITIERLIDDLLKPVER